jgi:protein SCO1/2
MTAAATCIFRRHWEVPIAAELPVAVAEALIPQILNLPAVLPDRPATAGLNFWNRQALNRRRQSFRFMSLLLLRPRLHLAVALAATILTSPALGRITPDDYRNVGVSAPANAAVPLDAVVTDEKGRSRALRELITKPTVLVFADYTCRTLCGPVIAFVAAALDQSGLDAGGQYRLLAVGLDPKDSAKDAEAMRQSRMPNNPELKNVTNFVTADAATIARLTSALGYRFHYDTESDTYIHPAAAYVVTAKGKGARVLTGLGLSGADMRLALVEAGQGKIGTFRDQVRLLCSAFDPAHGQYNAAVSRMLALAGGATVLALGGGIGLLALVGRRVT